MKLIDNILSMLGVTRKPIRKQQQLRYEAAKTTRSDKQRPVSTYSEDREQTPTERQRIISDARDLRRNFTLAGFVIRKHLQSVAWYQFAAKTHDRQFNGDLDRLIRRWSRREYCDTAGRHDFGMLTYLIEHHRATDGDIAILPRRDNRLQLIEGDRIRCSLGQEWSEDWRHGVRTDRYGKTVAYAIARRARAGYFEHERYVAARDIKLLGYYDRVDQIRGVSLLAPAIKMFQKLGESIDYALAKIKLEQLIGITTTLDDTAPLGGFAQEENDDAETPAEQRDKLINNTLDDIFDGNQFRLSLHPGEDAKFMESNNPSSNFQQFCELIIRVIFAAFDIPYSFFDGSKTNYYGSEGEFEQYIDSVEKKQQPTIGVLNEIMFDTILPNWILDGIITLPAGWTVDNLRDSCGFYGAGLPSWRMFRKIKDMSLAIQNGFISPYFAVSEYGYDLNSNLDDLARYRQEAADRGLTLPLFADTKTNVGL